MGGLPPEIKPLGNDELKRLFFRQAHEVGLENYRGHLTEYQVDTQRHLETLRIGNAAGAEAIKAVTLINGGAAVAVLAFLGHLVAIHASLVVLMNLAEPLGLFVLGVFASVLASGVTYLAHWCYLTALRREVAGKEFRRDKKNTLATTEERAAKRWNLAGVVINWGVVFIVAVSLGLFAGGCYRVYHAFKSGVGTLTEERLTRSGGLF